ncbi:hypothetical protein CI15_15550 [Paraburkholderia monticola]|uniref:Uncharacterized protein n=1 Tax=Paraburkholderia monticola TaxID=1399968 RepID=A0A149PRD2_9BURK|nr:hypothetical protein CI15_15550 [Paraburkholderia monticola]
MLGQCKVRAIDRTNARNPLPHAAIHAQNPVSSAPASALVAHVGSAASHHPCALPHQNVSCAPCGVRPRDLP